MRTEFQQILKYLKWPKPVYLYGPVGSGKTYLARAFPKPLAKKWEQENIFVLYTGFSYQPDRRTFQRPDQLNLVEAAYSFGGEFQTWERCKDAAKKLDLLPDLSQITDACDTIADWKLLFSFLKNSDYKMIIVLDDYDLWRKRRRNDQDFFELRQLQQDGAQFVLTSYEKFGPRVVSQDTSQEERNFLKEFKELSTSLPSNNDAIKIARACWSKQEHKKEGAVILEDEHYKNILKTTGNYPGLISCLISLLAESSAVDSSSDQPNIKIHRLIQISAIKSEFRDYLKGLWDSLDSSNALEKKAVALVTIANSTSRSVYDVYKVWKGSRPTEVPWPEEEDLKNTLDKIKNERLLLIKKPKEFSMSASAMLGFVFEQPLTKELMFKTSLDDTIKPYKFDQRKFLNRWFLGAFLYTVLLVLQLWLSRQDINLPKSLLFVAWIPPIWYFLKYYVGHK